MYPPTVSSRASTIVARVSRRAPRLIVRRGGRPVRGLLGTDRSYPVLPPVVIAHARSAGGIWPGGPAAPDPPGGFAGPDPPGAIGRAGFTERERPGRIGWAGSARATGSRDHAATLCVMSGHTEPRRRLRRQGPATLRGEHIPSTTTDQRLLDWRGSADWVHTDPWRVLRIQAEFVEGFGLLAELGRAVSVFGSARTAPGSADYQAGGRSAPGWPRPATRSSPAAARA